MPKYRQLHTKIVDSFDFAEMPTDFIRVTWLLLIVVMDSEGRAIDNAAWLRSKIYPLRTDVELSDIDEAMEWYETSGMIVRYKVENKSYFYIPTWKTYQSGTDKEAKSVLPAPPDPQPKQSEPTPEQLQSNSGATPPQYNADSIQHNADANAAAVFSCYQSNIGVITQSLSNTIGAAIDKYPQGWIEKAIDIAVENNARKWAYISAILERWNTDGFDAGKRNGKQPAIDPRNIPAEEF